jgi:hypothetical protein
LKNKKENLPMAIDAAPGPVFVVGLWRSGTSLLYTLLNQHPEIALMYEADLPLMRRLFTKAGSKADWLERWEFWNSALTRHGIDTQQIRHDIADLPSAAETVWKQYAGAAIFGEKSPNYYDSLLWLSEKFPNARFVVIWRDPADICRSIIRAREGSPFFAKRGITHRALIGTRRLKSECEALANRGVPLHEVQYEEMIEDPERVLSGICRFLHIPFDPRMASLEGADRSAIYDADHHAGVKRKTIGAKAREDYDDVLPSPLKNKIDRYVSYWQRQYAGKWPLYPAMPTGNHLKPSLLERSWDEVLFRGLRAFDRFTSLVYCYAPIALLRRYRSAKSTSRSPEPVKTEVGKEAASLSEVSTRS